MAEITQLTFVGDWRITVMSKSAGWSQRVATSGSIAGTVFVDGVPGQTLDILGNGTAPWVLRIEHNDGSTGWQPSWLRGTSTIIGVRLSMSIDSEDITTETGGDFNDLIIRVDKLGAVSQQVPPFAIRPETLQAMPEGFFEATLGRYFMAVRVTNIFTHPWPASARVGLSRRSRAWLAAGGANVVDAWSANEQAALGQTVVNGQVAAGGLPAWESRLIYFKVDVSAAQVRKHQVEVQVDSDFGAEATELISRKAKAPIQVSRTTFDASTNTFSSRCDVGTMTAVIKELAIDYNSFKRALGDARRFMRGSEGGGSTTPTQGCDPRKLEQVRVQLVAFLAGKDVDICAIWRDLACCCAGGTHDDCCDDWTECPGPELSFFLWPTKLDYTVDYRPSFAGQFGPIPYDDPWWKALLIIIAIILTIAAWASSTADLANRGDSVSIGFLTGSILNALSARQAVDPLSTEPGTIDAAVVTLVGNRDLTPAVFTELDAQSGEFFTTTPIVSLDGTIDTPGTFLTNAQIDAIFQNLADNPSDAAAQAAVRAYKSGARSGLGLGVMSSLVAQYPRLNDDGDVLWLMNQVTFRQDSDTTDSLSCSGDSGSLWFQQGTNSIIALNHAGIEAGTTAGASRIEDVINQLSIRFA
ncbi:hypothetical protein [Arthrobacter sp. ES3-54]|uniref:hypothetical protein n=1 Tax=Arthrobacter sp. ES3-54 TaxID=1502991 RepID=UPI0024072D0B|nr:hypothetical protein [Arthrobacter sp. ES3-54]MDF9749203.1 hypothetical protein [Arthrobacter sp. ES3-54]